MVTPLSEPYRILPVRGERGEPRPHPHAPLAVIAVCLSLLGGFSGAFWAGRRVERGSQLGQVLAASQDSVAIWGAIHALDSLSMQCLLGQSRRARPTHP